MNFIAWPEIESFHNIRKFVKAYPENLHGNDTVTYLGKVKLHGTNAAVQVHTDGTVVAQSRSQLLLNGQDNAGFAKWVRDNEATWKACTPGYVYFGEWIGPGVQKGVACSEIPNKAFAVFAARPLVDYILSDSRDVLIVEPNELRQLVGPVPDTYILPWHTYAHAIEWTGSAELLTSKVEQINESVMMIEENDPWIESIFRVKGTGEGLVFYPVSKEHLGFANFSNLVFKAKGEKHKNIKTAAPAQIDASAAESVSQFVDMVLTDARLEQGAGVVGGTEFNMKFLGDFLKWINADVQKETQDEMEASNLTWKKVSKAIGDKARAWYVSKAQAL